MVGGGGHGKKQKRHKRPDLPKTRLTPERRRRTRLVGLATSDELRHLRRHLSTELFGYLKEIVNVEYIQIADLPYSGVPNPTDALRRCDHHTIAIEHEK